MAANLLKLATSSTCAAALKGHIIAGCLHNDFSTLLSEFLHICYRQFVEM